MEIRVKYNNDLAFRRKVAFRRMYPSANFARRMKIEMGILAFCVVAAAAVYLFGGDVRYSSYAFYVLAIVAVILLARLLRAAVIRARIKPGDASRAEREFVFGEKGFTFGPMNEAGDLLETRWQDVDHAYLTKDVLYLMCMNRRHWAAVDKNLLAEGSWEELLSLVRANLANTRVSAAK